MIKLKKIWTTATNTNTSPDITENYCKKYTRPKSIIQYSSLTLGYFNVSLESTD